MCIGEFMVLLIRSSFVLFIWSACDTLEMCKSVLFILMFGVVHILVVSDGSQYSSVADGIFRKPSEGQSLISYLSEQDFGSCADLEKVGTCSILIHRKLKSVYTMTETIKLTFLSLCSVGKCSFQHFRVPYSSHWTYEVQPAAPGGGGWGGGRQWLWNSAAQAEDPFAEAADPPQPPAALRNLPAP